MVGIVNLKWRDALQVAGHAFRGAEQEAGWPVRMSAWQLAAMQRPRYFTPHKRMMEPDPHDPVAAAQIGQNAGNMALFKALQAEFDAGHGPDTAALFAAWLAANGEQPSPHVAAWFESQGIGAAPDVAPVPKDAHKTVRWQVTKPQRYHGYASPLHRFLSAAHRDGKPRPSAREILEAWRLNPPAEIAQVLTDGFNYYDAKGNTKAADLEAIRKAIDRMTNAR